MADIADLYSSRVVDVMILGVLRLYQPCCEPRNTSTFTWLEEPQHAFLSRRVGRAIETHCKLPDIPVWLQLSCSSKILGKHLFQLLDPGGELLPSEQRDPLFADRFDPGQ